MKLSFYKFQGAGNDFILLDNRQGGFSQVGLQQQEGIAGLCHRHLGVGADGLMLLEDEPGFDFRMIYYNSDGLPGSMCGNGARCIVAFARLLGLIGNRCSFMASDGPHQAEILEEDASLWSIALQMQDTDLPLLTTRGYQVDTGSPHLVVFMPGVSGLDVVNKGRLLRNAVEFSPNGINVNFVRIIDEEHLQIRTYERGVENETLACGTGAVAAAIAAYGHGIINSKNRYMLQAPGGELVVSFSPPAKPGLPVRNVILTGPAKMVFQGEIKL